LPVKIVFPERTEYPTRRIRVFVVKRSVKVENKEGYINPKSRDIAKHLNDDDPLVYDPKMHMNKHKKEFLYALCSWRRAWACGRANLLALF